MSQINSTTDYYRYGRETLGWELTVCNALYPENSPCRSILRRNDSYGNLLYEYLNRFVPMAKVEHIIEVGGGYGYLTKDFLYKKKSLKATMLDISPYLSGRQRETLDGFDVHFVVEDFLDTDTALLKRMDMAILNENLGDFPTLVAVPKAVFKRSVPEDSLARMKTLFDQYAFEEPEAESFHFNIGAIEAVERLCESGIPYIFLGEHSCEASVPENYKGLIRIPFASQPEKICLKGHNEYTIKFSYLEKVAQAFYYQAIRGPFADFIEFDFNKRVKSIMASPALINNENEIIRQFVEDLFKYEYLILMKAT